MTWKITEHRIFRVTQLATQNFNEYCILRVERSDAYEAYKDRKLMLLFVSVTLCLLIGT